MAKQTRISINLNGLEEMRRALGDSYITRVGVLAGHRVTRFGSTTTYNTKTGKPTSTPTVETMNNAEIGVIHEFGSAAAGIPPRSWLRMPIETKRRELVAFMMGPRVQDAFGRGQFKKVFQLLGLKAESIVQQGFETGGFGQWPALKAGTIKAKGSSAPLINTAQLRRSVTSDVVRKTK